MKRILKFGSKRLVLLTKREEGLIQYGNKERSNILYFLRKNLRNIVEESLLSSSDLEEIVCLEKLIKGFSNMKRILKIGSKRLVLITRHEEELIQYGNKESSRILDTLRKNLRNIIRGSILLPSDLEEINCLERLMDGFSNESESR